MSARRRLAPFAAAALLALASAGPAPAAAPTSADVAPLLLRLPDLGPGYTVEGFSGASRSCSRFDLRARRVPRTLRGLRRFRSRGCVLLFERAWSAPGAPAGPDSVTSLAIAFDEPAGAEAALARARALAAMSLGFAPRYLPRPMPLAAVGDEAVQLRLRFNTRGRPSTAAFVMWRSGSAVGLVMTGSARAGDADVEAAHRLAAVQQGRIAAPTPLRPPVNDDRFVLLDDPSLGVPVLWLGERFPGADGFPPLRLRETNATWRNGRVPEVRLIYQTRRLPEAVTIELWEPRDARRLLRSRLYDYQCERRFDGGLDGVRSTIVALYLREDGRCPRRGAFLDAAYARFDDVFVRIDAIGCCRSVIPPYDSLAGLRTLLRSLRPRPAPTP